MLKYGNATDNKERRRRRLEIRVPLLEFSAARGSIRMQLPARCRDKGGKGDVKRKYSRILITRFIRQAEYQARFCIPMNISGGISVRNIPWSIR